VEQIHVTSKILYSDWRANLFGLLSKMRLGAAEKSTSQSGRRRESDERDPY
jgi:hypothetical protein